MFWQHVNWAQKILLIHRCWCCWCCCRVCVFSLPISISLKCQLNNPPQVFFFSRLVLYLTTLTFWYTCVYWWAAAPSNGLYTAAGVWRLFSWCVVTTNLSNSVCACAFATLYACIYPVTRYQLLSSRIRSIQLNNHKVSLYIHIEYIYLLCCVRFSRVLYCDSVLLIQSFIVNYWIDQFFIVMMNV